MKILKILSTSLLATIALLLAPHALGAKINPVYESEKVPDQEDESALWESASRHENRLRNSGTVISSPHVEQYIESVAARMLGDDLDHLGIQIDFILVEEPNLSAWAYPYGTIGIQTGLLVRMDNEAQFAAILAHEISHFLQRHTYREMLDKGKQSAFGKGLGVLATLALAKETGSFDAGVMDFTEGLWTNLATSGYSKKNEYVADEEGLVLMGKAGLLQDEAVPAFEALAENAVYGAADPRKMWSSHPRLEDRIKNLKKEIKSAKRKKGFEAGAVPDELIYYRGIAPALIINARLDLKEQQYQRARDALTKYLMVRPDDPEGHFLVGETYRRENPVGPDIAPSMTAYRDALQQDSGYAQAHKELGMAYRVQHQNAEARAAFETYLSLAEDAPDAGIIRGYMEGLQ
jgi:predicted Zn-dependent protease